MSRRENHRQSDTGLKRSLSLPLLLFYGLGTILGAGIYVLIGEVAREAGQLAPLSFLVAAVLATFTAFSYAELSARFPVSAGEAYYVQQALGRRWLSTLVGCLVILIAIISSAAMCNGFAGYFGLWLELPDWITVSALVLILGLIASWGITESVTLASVITLIEIGGLVLVAWLGRDALFDLPTSVAGWGGPWAPGQAGMVMAGAFVAFFAFIGFEDMVNVAEEVRRPSRSLPLAIILALILSTAVYLMIAITAVLSLPVQLVSDSRAPLAEIVRFHKPGLVPTITAISLVAVINGALIQIIKASRVIYGMACNGMAPRLFTHINPRTRTPLPATALCTLLIAVLALSLDLSVLARLTSFVTLLVFAGVNAALLFIKRTQPQYRQFRVPTAIPIAGLTSCLLFIGYELSTLC